MRTALSFKLRALARLLDYPDETLIEALPEIAQVLAPARDSALSDLIAELGLTDLLDVQERYVETFDRGRSTSLNLFEHVHGESRDRGQAMVDLVAMYHAAGLMQTSTQLPDYLPVYLEFAAISDDSAALAHLQEVSHLVRAIGEGLLRRQSPWSAAIGELLAIAGEEALAPPADELEDDSSPAAIDRLWEAEQVQFLGACQPAAPAPVQPIQFHRRTA
ncbi:MAG: nitrate reductase molybdenum cofactor assembly chaperone [Burkholderiaceae bacterium]